MIPKQYKARMSRFAMTEAKLRDEFGLTLKTDAAWDALMNSTNRLLPNPLPPIFSNAKDRIFDEGLATVAEASRSMRLNRATIYRAMGRGDLPFVKIGRARRIPWVALRLWLEAI